MKEYRLELREKREDRQVDVKTEIDADLCLKVCVHEKSSLEDVKYQESVTTTLSETNRTVIVRRKRRRMIKEVEEDTRGCKREG